MDASTPSPAVDNSAPLNSEQDAEVNKLAEKKFPKLDPERIRSSVARLTSNSIEGLEGLSSELQTLQKFLKSEVERVQGEIESALAGIKIIIDTIAPWKSTPVPSPTSTRVLRAGPAANIEGAQSRK
jgi:hypothetical protein